MEITYTNHEGFYLPNLTLPRKEEASFGRYGRLRLKYLEEHRRVLYINLLTSGELAQHLNEADQQAREMLELLYLLPALVSIARTRRSAPRPCSILFSAGKTCVRLSGGTGSSGEAQHFPGLHLYLPGLSTCVSLFSTSRTTSAGIIFSNFSALRQRDSNAEMWARC